MKRTAIAFATAALLASGSASADLVLTGVVDGPASGGLPKAIELYATADIADLSIYGVELVSNAGSTAGVAETFFSGSISAGEFYYVATEAVEFAAAFGFAPDQTTGDVNHNGDDDFYIYKNGVVIDVWGGSDGVDNTGTEADTLDSWAYRNDDEGPNTTFTASEWTIAPVDSLDGLSPSEVGSTVPFGTYTPEPGSLALLGLGGLIIARRRKG